MAPERLEAVRRAVERLLEKLEALCGRRLAPELEPPAQVGADVKVPEECGRDDVLRFLRSALRLADLAEAHGAKLVTTGD